MDQLDQIPWQNLHHAYGSAKDVPDWIRGLREPKSKSNSGYDNEAPLDHLFASICHQGTIYEVTSYAVPFLIELVQDETVPNREGILSLLEAIASGTSYLVSHESFLRKFPVPKIGTPGTEEFKRKKKTEIEWVKRSRDEIEKGFDIYVELTRHETDLAHAAASLLARIESRATEVLVILQRMLEREKRELYRAGLILLIGQVAGDSNDVWNIYRAAATSESVVEQRAAALVVATIHEAELEPPFREAVIEAICDEDLFDERFDGIPWDWGRFVSEYELITRPESEKLEAAERILVKAEKGEAGGEAYGRLVEMFFDRGTGIIFEDVRSLSDIQKRIAESLVQAMEVHRINLHMSFLIYGLPDSRRDLKNLLAGKPKTVVDETLPVIGYAETPMKPKLLASIREGDRIHSRYFGLGKVMEVEDREYDIEFHIEFDDEGYKVLGLSESLNSFVAAKFRYYWWKLFGKKRNADEKAQKAEGDVKR